MVTENDVTVGAEEDLSLLAVVPGYSLLGLATTNLAIKNLLPNTLRPLHKACEPYGIRQLVYVIAGDAEIGYPQVNLPAGGVLIINSTFQMELGSRSGAKLFVAKYPETGFEDRSAYIGHIDDFKATKGYLVGGFMRDHNLRTTETEIAVMNLPVADPSKPHYHRRMSEITYAYSGGLDLKVGGREPIDVRLEQGNFVLIKAGVILQNPSNDPNTQIVVVKAPSVQGDKYYYEG